ncbi:Hypothetical predicted protein [Paramuricea clavata]|uniref:Uncharacterized protein n=1 Tax=Paramuricea clavata TaxID=317549 RepID=A0A7D9F0Z1_PARCT|nr:Hypothetical predicted protein [Paramuricea clavata]
MDPGSLAQYVETVRNEVEAIDNLIQQGKLQKIEIEREQLELNTQAAKLGPGSLDTYITGLKGRVKPRLANLVTDLCSALDRLCYLIYCHCNNGSHSTEAENIKFPSKVTRRSDSQLKNEFADEHFNIIFTANTDEQVYDRFEAIIWDCLREMGAGGQGAWIPDTLHFLRIHWKSVHITVEWNRLQKNWGITVRSDEYHRAPEWLIKVTSSLPAFVRNIRNSLLEKSFPKDYNIPTFA